MAVRKETVKSQEREGVAGRTAPFTPAAFFYLLTTSSFILKGGHLEDSLHVCLWLFFWERLDVMRTEQDPSDWTTKDFILLGFLTQTIHELGGLRRDLKTGQDQIPSPSWRSAGQKVRWGLPVRGRAELQLAL